MKKTILFTILLLLMVGLVSATCSVCNETCSPCGGGCTATDFSQMYENYDFNGDPDGIGDITGWNTSCYSNINSYAMFKNSTFNQDISGWDTHGFKNMNSMFKNATEFNQPIGSWDTSQVTDMADLFYGATSFNQDLNSWDTSSVTTMSNMFRDATNFNGDVSSWDTSEVTNMGFLFYKTAFNQDVSNWDVGKAQYLGGMFYNTPFNQDIGNWNTTSALHMWGMFYNTPFNQDIGNWDTHNAVIMHQMFQGDTAFNQDISGWDTGKVGDNHNMFDGATSFDQNIGSWNISSLTFAGGMFGGGAYLSPDNYDALLIGWANQSPNIQSSVSFNARDSRYSSAGKVGRDILTGTYGWDISDSGRFWNYTYTGCIDDFKAFLETNGRNMPSGTYNLCPNMAFNITPDGDYTDYNYWTALFYMSNGDSILNCNGSTIYMDRDYYGFVDINTQNNQIQNCNFERRYTNTYSEGCNCISDVTFRGMVLNNWDDPENPFYRGDINKSAYSKLINCTFQNSSFGDGFNLNMEMAHDIEVAGNTFNHIYLRGNFNFHDNSFYDLMPTRNSIFFNERDFIWDSLVYNINGGNHLNWIYTEGMFNTEIYNSSFRNLFSINESSSFNVHDITSLNGQFAGQNVIVRNSNFNNIGIYSYTSTSENFSIERNNITTTLTDNTNYASYNVSFCPTGVGNNLTTYVGGNVYELGTCHVPSIPCTENWAGHYTTCISNNKTLYYTDVNNCGTYDNLPVNNGTITSCGVGNHITGDIPAVIIDIGVETGMEFIKYIGLIALVGLGIRLMAVL